MFQKFPAPGPMLSAPQCSVVHWLRCMALLSVCSGYTCGSTMGRAHHGEASVRSCRSGPGLAGLPASATHLASRPGMAASVTTGILWGQWLRPASGQSW